MCTRLRNLIIEFYFQLRKRFLGPGIPYEAMHLPKNIYVRNFHSSCTTQTHYLGGPEVRGDAITAIYVDGLWHDQVQTTHETFTFGSHLG